MSIKLKDTIYDLVSESSTATKATQDGSGDTITSTYLKLSGGTITGSYGVLNIKRNHDTYCSLIGFSNNSGNFGYLGMDGNGSGIIYNKDATTGYNILTSNNWSTYAAAKDHNHNSTYAPISHSHSNYVDLSSAQTISGKKTFSNGLAITGGATENTALPYFIGIEAYADGGTVKYISRDKVLACIGAASSGHTHSYLPLSGGSLSGPLQINTSIQNHSSPTAQCLVINSTAVPSGTTLTIKNSPGIGFHVANSSWASLVLMSGKFHFINNSADGYVNIISNGFEKNGSSNSYVLLGGGGHRAVSDFATSSHTHSYIKYETGSKSTINGQQSPCLYNIEGEDLVTNYYSYWYVLNMGSYSGGGFRSQLAMPYQDSLTDSELFIRTAKGSTWRDWRRVLTSSNYSAYAATKDHTHSQYLTSLPSHTHSYLPLSGGTMTGNIKVYTDGDGRGLKFGSSTLNSLSNQLLWQSAEAIRFGSPNWDWNQWAGLKYNYSSKIIYLGIPDNVIFNANSAQSGGSIYTPGVSNIYIGNGTYTVWHSGNFAPGNYMPKSGGAFTGSVTFANGTWNVVGDDAAIGDYNAAGMLGLKSCNNNIPGIGFHNSAGTLLGRLQSNGSTIQWNDQTIIHSGNIGSQSVNYANYAAYLPPLYIGGQQTNPQTYFNNGIGVRVAMTGMSSKGTSYWSDTLWINGYSGGDVPYMCALHFNRDGSPRAFISTQSNQSSSYGTFYEFITGYNIGSQSVNYANSAGSVAWGNVSGKPSSFTPSSHTHDYAASNHSHTYYWANVAVSTSSSTTTSPTFGHVSIYATGTGISCHTSGTNSVAGHFQNANCTSKLDSYATVKAVTSGSSYVGFYTNGKCRYASASSTSDRRLKKDIKYLTEYSDEYIKKIDNIDFVSFRYNDSKDENSFLYGFIAQDVQKYFPEIVDSSNEYLCLDYNSCFVLKIASLERKIKILEEKLKEVNILF